MALTVITEDPAVRELGDLIIVGDLVGLEEFTDRDAVGEVMRDGESERSERSSGAGQDDSENEDEQKEDGQKEDEQEEDEQEEDDGADGEAEDDDTESERS
jgi:hypothetical protein